MNVKNFPIERVLSVNKTERGFQLQSIAGEIARVTFEVSLVSDSIVRTRFYFGSKAPQKADSLVFTAGNLKPLEFKFKETHENVELISDKLTVKVEKNPFEICFIDENGKVLTKSVIDANEIADHFLTNPTGFTATGSGRDSVSSIEHSHLTFLHYPHEKYYGFGEKFTRFNKSGQNITIRNGDAYGARGETSYKNIPFFTSSRGYGMFVDDPGILNFHMGDLSSRSSTIDIPGQEFDCYFIYGPTPKEIISSYTELTGKPPMLPKWSFGLWLSTYFKEATESSVREQVDKVRELGISADVFHFDCYWLRDKYWTDFIWDDKAFPDPEGFIKELKEKGFKVSLWENPYVSVQSDLFDEGVEKNYFLKKKNGSVYLAMQWPEDMASLTAIVDFTNPEAYKWWAELHQPLLDMGVNVFKTDFGEEIPEDAVFYNGYTGKELRNIYPLYYNACVFNKTEEQTGEGLVWARSATAGSQRYPTHWSGDPHCTFEDMAFVLRGGLSFSMSGMAFWSHDIGGFIGKPTEELLIRWGQFGFFTAHSRIHGWSNRNPWDFSNRAVENFSKYSRLRYSFLPYIYSYAIEASNTGIPLMRPMIMEFPEDFNTHSVETQYMFGKEILISPVFDEDGDYSTYLPEGKWIDFWTNDIHKGSRYIHGRADLLALPFFIKMNSILPRMKPEAYISDGLFDLDIDVYLEVNQSAEFKYSDTGVKATFLAERTEDSLIFKTEGDKVNLNKVRFHFTGPSSDEIKTVNSPQGNEIQVKVIG